ncbi:hypothetical protein BDV98DRAFT_572191 [Pterulicium gracile]|uniref:F-box domain-containing protein n=1 Tax=Pterulicium gracile TaxID=1884261 RepID=A0A5C3QC89_9AGAR|nr:hypothetical protein BDV98DRAFT_572191 [Pterula gracilis]
MYFAASGGSDKPGKHDLHSPFSHLLHNNLPLPNNYSQRTVDSIVRQAESTLRVLRDNITDLHRLLSERQSHLLQIQNFVKGHRQLSERRLITSFPPELLHAIFGFLVEETHNTLSWTAKGLHDSLSYRNPVWVVSQHPSPELWAPVTLAVCSGVADEEDSDSINVAKNNGLSRLGAQLALFGFSPLSIRLIVDLDAPEVKLDHLRSLLQLLFLNRTRWRRLHITTTGGCVFFEELLNHLASSTTAHAHTPLFPRLETFEYSSNAAEIQNVPNYVPPGSFPCLNTLKISGVSEEASWLTVMPWAQLQVLSISDCYDNDLYFFQNIMPQLLCLQRLSLRLYLGEEGEDVPSSHYTTYNLPALHTLDVAHISHESDLYTDVMPDWSTCLIPLGAPQLRHFHIGCISIDAIGIITVPFPTFAVDALAHWGSTITHFQCMELACGTHQTLVEIFQCMPALRSLEVGIVLGVSNPLDRNPSPESLTTMQHLSAALQLDSSQHSEMTSTSPAQDLFPELEHITVRFKVYSRRVHDRDTLIPYLLDALEPRFGKDKLRKVDAVFSAPRGVPEFVLPGSSRQRIEEVRYRWGVIVRLEQFTEERSSWLEEDVGAAAF